MIVPDSQEARELLRLWHDNLLEKDEATRMHLLVQARLRSRHTKQAVTHAYQQRIQVLDKKGRMYCEELRKFEKAQRWSSPSIEPPWY